MSRTRPTRSRLRINRRQAQLTHQAKDERALAAAARRAATGGKATPEVLKVLEWEEDSGEEGDGLPEDPVERIALNKPTGDWILRLPTPVTAVAPRLDIVFQIDTTGSMHDEIRAIQATVKTVAERIEALKPKPRVRWGLVPYGDRGDPYVVRRYPFTADAAEFCRRLIGMTLTGGGDMPEAALEGLHAAVSEMKWTTENAIRLVFLIADAPPHLNYGRPYTYLDKMREAAAKGVKIYPVAASGLNKQGEYIFRQWAQATTARFLFITYGAGTPKGGPAGKTPHEVKQPTKRNNLDDIIVGVVRRELQQWTRPELYSSGATDRRLPAPRPAEEEELF